MAKFIHLRNHTEYSLCLGAIKLKKFVSFLSENKIPAVAMTDCHNLFGALEFSVAACKAGVQPIIGCEVVVDGSNFLFNGTKNIQTQEQRAKCFCKIILIAKSDQGFLNLIKLISDSYLNRKNGIDPHITLDKLEESNDGLIVLSGGVEGILGKAILNNNKNIEDITKYFLDNFGNDFYMEIQRHGQENEIKTEDKFIELAYKYNIPLVATNDCYFLKKSMFEAQDALSCIGTAKYVSQDDRKKLTPEHYFKSEDEMCELFRDLPEAVENTVKIAKRVHTCAYTRKPTLPHFQLPEGVSEADEMTRISREGLEERLKQKFIVDDISDPEEQKKVREEYFKQLEFELGVIIQMDFPGYFLIVADFIVWSKTHGVPIGPGRGSGAGSVVAWSMKITDLDPIKFSLFFERFLNPERVSMPDFDVDFCQRGRERSIEYVQNKYGKDMVAQIITFGKLQAKAVVKDIGRVLEMGYSDVDKISKMIPFGATLEEALEQDKDLREQRAKDPDVQKLLDIALQLEGLNRHSSVHAAGVVIGDKPLKQICPLYFDDKAEMPVVQYDKKYCEEAGLVKFDFLGLKTLTVIKDAIDFVKQDKNININIDNIKLNDKNIFKMLQIPDSLGVFQIESSGMQGMLKQIRPDNIEDIIALISLYRPGPMDSIPTYIRRKHGLEPVEYMHPKMEAILKDTYGIIIYQEQVMNIAKALAGYTLGGADLLRRAMGKKIKEEMDKQRGVFVKGCKEFSDIDEELSNKIFDLLAKFAEYGFNKAHAAAYAVIGYQTAYLKCYHIVEFLTSTINMEIIDTDKINFYLQDVKRHNIKILPPDINKSDAYFKPEKLNSGENNDENKSGLREYDLKEHDFGIRYSLGALKGVGTAIVEIIMEERSKNGSFKSIFDFCSRMGSKIVNKKTIESLAKSGAFDSIHGNRKQICDSCEILSNYAKFQEEERNSIQFSLFGNSLDENEKTLPKLSNTDDWQGYDRFQAEFEAFGFYLQNHPLTSIRNELSQKGITFSNELEEDYVEDGCTINMAGVVISTSIKSGPKGRYAFISTSDPEGLVEVSIFNNDMITQRKDWLDDNLHNQLVFTCTVRKDESGIRVSARDFYLLEDYLKLTEIGVEKIKKPFKRGNGEFQYRKKSEPKEDPILAKKNQENNFEYYKNVKVYIRDENELNKFSKILESCISDNEEKITDIVLIIKNNDDEQSITLPKKYLITPQKIYEIKFVNKINAVLF